jgi:histidine triad (HIT) family protein
MKERGYHGTRPSYPVHIVAIPKKHIPSLITLEESDSGLLLELMAVIQLVATQLVSDHGACRVVINLGRYQDSKHLHLINPIRSPNHVG